MKMDNHQICFFVPFLFCDLHNDSRGNSFLLLNFFFLGPATGETAWCAGHPSLSMPNILPRNSPRGWLTRRTFQNICTLPYWASEITKYPAQGLSRPLWLRWHGGDLTPHACLISSHVYVLWAPLCPSSPRPPFGFYFSTALSVFPIVGFAPLPTLRGPTSQNSRLPPPSLYKSPNPTPQSHYTYLTHKQTPHFSSSPSFFTLSSPFESTKHNT